MEKGNDSLKTNIREASCELHLMDLQQRYLTLAGLYPSKDIKSSFRKIILFRLYQIAIFSTYMALLFLKLCGCFHYRDDLLTFLDAIVAVGLGVMGNFIPLSANWKDATELVHEIERDSVFVKAIIQNNTKNIKLLKDAQRSTKLVTYNLLVFSYICGVIWIIQPHIFAVLESFINNIDNSNSTIVDPLKIYPCIIWLPHVDITATIPYVAISTLTGICILFLNIRMAAIASYCVSIMIYISTQFKLVTTCLYEIDNVDENGLKSNDVSNLKIDKAQEEFRKSHEENLEDDNIRIKSRKFGMNESVKSELTKYDKYVLLCPEEIELNAICQLKSSVKDHQQILKSIKDVNDAFSFMFFMFIMIAACAFSFALFIATVSPHFTLKLKFGSVVVAIFVAGWIIFSNGEDVKEEGVQLHHAAYNLHWFTHSTEFKKILLMLIMRSQKPCGIMLGPIMDMTMENYSAIVNTAYSYFTILVQFESKNSEDGTT